MYKIAFFVPLEHVQKVKMAMFEAGAGRIGNYDCCSFETNGVGQFRPLEGSNAFIGEVDKIETVEELKVEMVCADKVVHSAIKALKSSHPYETPAYDVWKVEQF
jgi:hypothetical protein